MKAAMKKVMAAIFIGALAFTRVGAQDIADSSNPEIGADLYRHMLEGGLISDEQYQHFLNTGTLSYASSQDIQTEAGIPGPQKASPARERRDLSPAARKARAAIELRSFSEKMREQSIRRRVDARQRAKASGIEVRQELTKGGQKALDYFDDLGHPQFNLTENIVSADTISTDEVWPAGTNGYTLSGSPVVLGIWDGGAVRSTHQEFGGRVSLKDDALSQYGISGHSTGVAGTMGSGGGYAPSRGMSYASTIHAYDWDYYLSELADSTTNDVLISNHSWGWVRGWRLQESTWYWYGNWTVSPTSDYQFGLYDAEAQARDQFVYDAVYCLPVWSSGNDRGEGPASQPVTHKIWNGAAWVDSTVVRNVDGGANGFDTIGSRKTAKNILTIGAVDDIVGGYNGPSSVVMSSFSGFGPTDDGRIKPDLVANGIGLVTPYGTADNSYVSYSGTSFSTPSVSGSLGLLQQLNQQLHGTNSPLWTSTYKALLIHTADESGSNLGPDYRFGWGLMNTFSAAKLMTTNADYNSKPHIKECVLPDGDEARFSFLADTNMPIRVTLAWTDVPGPIQPSSLDPTNLTLVNDLDLRVIAPSGTTNYPWILDPANPANAATTGDNFRDNVEQVYIANATTGLYTVVVSHKGSLSNFMQDFSVVLSGNIAQDLDVEITDIASESGAKQIQWAGAVGSMHNVQSTTNLLEGDGWSELSDDISIIRDLTEWTDLSSTNSAELLRFYRINEVK